MSILAKKLYAHTFSREPKASAVLSVALVGLLSALASGGCEGQTLDQRIKSTLAPEPITDVGKRIASPNPDERREALQAVAADAQLRSVPEIVHVYCVKAKSDPDPLAQSAAVRGLALMDGPEVIPCLVSVLSSDPRPFVRAEAAVSLGCQAKPECIEPLVSALKAERSPDVRVVVAEALRNFADPAAAKLLAAALADPSLAVEQRAWESLRYMTGQNLDRRADAWTEFLASSKDPFADYGHPPRMPRGDDQRPNLIQGPMDLFRNLFTKDIYAAELE